MKIILENIGRRFNREWIFREINYTFESGQSYAVLGLNGSGKSTLLQLLSGSLTPSEGTISYQSGGKDLDIESVFQQLSMAAPYMELIEEFTLQESIEFHAQFKPFYKGLDTKKIIELTQLEKAKDKQLKVYSSGMKQRVRLALAILCDTPLLLLDEPTSNLDKKAIDWYQNLINDYSQNRLIIVCSNQQEYEYPFCNKELQIEEYK